MNSGYRFFVDPIEQNLPLTSDNTTAGEQGTDGYDYGVFYFVNMFSKALFDKPFSEISTAQQDEIYNKCKADVSDYVPAWVRIVLPQ